jgi:hypothetical protein
MAMPESDVKLAELFSSVAQVLGERREEINASDEFNHNHGDHMREIFQVAARAAGEKEGTSLADAMEYGAELLRALNQNGSAQVYARGLSLLAAQFRQSQIELDDLLPAVRSYLVEKQNSEKTASANSGELLKALLAALAEWKQVEANLATGDGSGKAGKGLDMGYLFGVGMAYMQAKQMGGDKLDILSETVVSSSPLANVPQRQKSGVMAVRALLEGMSR